MKDGILKKATVKLFITAETRQLHPFPHRRIKNGFLPSGKTCDTNIATVTTNKKEVRPRAHTYVTPPSKNTWRSQQRSKKEKQ
jgi:hypothetical protein